MYPLLFLVMLFSSVAAIHALRAPEAADQARASEAEVAAKNFVLYRAAVVRFVVMNPGYTGTVADSSLTLQAGYTKDSRWSAYAAAGTAYVYTQTAPTPHFVAAVRRMSFDAVNLAQRATSATAVGVVEPAVSWSLPSAVGSATSSGAVIWIGG